MDGDLLSWSDSASSPADQALVALAGAEDDELVYFPGMTGRATKKRKVRMPVPWVLHHNVISVAEAVEVVDRLKSHRYNASDKRLCSLCIAGEAHLMRYKLAYCTSPICTAAAIPGLSCAWRMKVELCTKGDKARIYFANEHLVAGSDPPSGRLTQAQKDRVSYMCHLGVKPKRMRTTIASDTPATEIPDLSKLQSFVAYYRKKKMKNTNDLDVVANLIEAQAYTGLEDEVTAFSFTPTVNEHGKPVVGDGSDSEPFIVGYTTKRLLRNMDRPVDSFILHADATYKLNQVEYPVIVIGISDVARSFHLVALVVASQRQGEHYCAVLNTVKAMYTKVVGKPLVARYVLGDADRAQFNAVREVFRESDVTYLMCFYHVMAKVIEKSRAMDHLTRGLVCAEVYDMHFAKSDADFHAAKTAAMIRWKADPSMAEFGNYFNAQWLQPPFNTWQSFRTPCGFATTNNPVETYNSKIKSVYTLRERLTMGMLLNKLAECCLVESKSPTQFHTASVVDSKLVERASQLRRVKEKDGGPYLLCTEEEDDYMLIMSRATPRVYLKARGKSSEVVEVATQMGVNTGRMERDGQPSAGWPVDMRNRSCPCKYFFKYGVCVHLLHALYLRYSTYTPEKRALVNRSSKGKKKSLADQIAEAVSQQQQARGRPIINGPALSRK